MSKVITVSRTFPAYHPKKEQPTYFVEKILKALPHLHPRNAIVTKGLNAFFNEQVYANALSKHHTIRAGKRWKTGDKASLRVWSGKPYRSPQIIIAPDVELVVKDFEIDIDGCIWIDGNYFAHPEILAEYDGLTEDELSQWFNKVPFSGQLLIWNNNNLPY